MALVPSVGSRAQPGDWSAAMKSDALTKRHTGGPAPDLAFPTWGGGENGIPFLIVSSSHSSRFFVDCFVEF